MRQFFNYEFSARMLLGSEVAQGNSKELGGEFMSPVLDKIKVNIGEVSGDVILCC